MYIRIIFFSITCLCQLLFFTYHAAAGTDMPVSFFQLVGPAGWELSVNDFSISTVLNDTELKLRVQDRHYLRFSARQAGDKGTIFLGPLQPRYKKQLSGLIEYALAFCEQEKNIGFSMDIDWNLYPESIQKWAVMWQVSPLNKKWNQMDPHLRYKNLTAMISGFLKTDMYSISKDLGFDIIGASMEKMSFPKARQLNDYDRILAPAGILPDLKVPIPLMLSIRLTPFPDGNPALYPLSNYLIDSLFAVAKKDSTSLYCSFNRTLDEYEITGDIRHSDAPGQKISPLIGTPQPIASRLLNAVLTAAKDDTKNMFSLRTDLTLHAGLYQEAIKYANPVPQNLMAIAPRQMMNHAVFYRFVPQENKDFLVPVNSFLNQLGYEFNELQISLTPPRKADQCALYEPLLKPMGYLPEEMLALPDIVYVIAVKKESL